MLGKDSEGSPPLLSRDAQQALAHGMEEGRGGPRIGGKEKGGGETDREEEEEEARRGGDYQKALFPPPLPFPRSYNKAGESRE